MITYVEVGAAIGRLVDEKQKAYGNSFGNTGKLLRMLYPDRIRPDQYDNLLALVRMIVKLFRIATKKDAFGKISLARYCRLLTADEPKGA
ncbi:MAG: hypothetical protein M0P16_03455 [Syntrophales bacterium]|jgi:hypothetical protein|nr:hypothetical protein [Syntrophales bacterium]